VDKPLGGKAREFQRHAVFSACRKEKRCLATEATSWRNSENGRTQAENAAGSILPAPAKFYSPMTAAMSSKAAGVMTPVIHTNTQKSEALDSKRAVMAVRLCVNADTAAVFAASGTAANSTNAALHFLPRLRNHHQGNKTSELNFAREVPKLR